MLGTVGNLLILIAFVAAVLSGISFFLSVRQGDRGLVWKRLGRQSWVVVAATTVAAFGLLVYLFATHQYRYAYVYQHSSNDLPTYFTISATWAGQEGSFMIWIVLTSLIGCALMLWARRPRNALVLAQRQHFEAPVMAMMALTQAFMVAMVVGIQLGPLAIGSSPFITLAERFPDAPFLQAGGVPADGNGLNDLLQNYWMTIHPPTLFVGFALMTVPFAFAVAALWTRQYTEWVKPALPWTLAAVLVLGVGVMMGGYWAYVTLSFGGWWAWDPVENSSLVPWLFGVAAIHAMIVQKRSAAGHKSALILAIMSFVFVVYSTFLTRSGILGDVSVHSFVDLGLYNQLLLWIGTMTLLGLGLFAIRYRELPTPARPAETLSRENMIFSGALILTLIGVVVIIGTSAPILGRIFLDSPAAVAIDFYNAWTLPLAVILATLAGLGQLFWWKRMDIADVNRAVMKPLGLAVVCTAGVILTTPFIEMSVQPPTVEPGTLQAGFTASAFWEVYGYSLGMLMLTFASFFAVFGNGSVMWRIARGNPKLAGGSLAHVGMGLMLLGIVATGLFQRPLSEAPGANIAGDRDNFIVQRDQTLRVQQHTFTYVGQTLSARGRPVYQIDVTDPRGRGFRAEAEVYQSRTGQWIQHPHVQKYLDGDLYIAVFPSAMMAPAGDGAAQPGEILMEQGDAAPLDDGAYSLRFVGFDLQPDVGEIDALTEEIEVAVGARLILTERSSGNVHEVAPVYAVMTDGRQHVGAAEVPDLGIRVSFRGMQVERGSGAVRLVVQGARTMPDDWLVIQARRKPLINLLWLGTLVLFAGVALAIYRRATDQRR
jgi:cytochrome c-type biogenesis protein CcmF